MKKVFSIAAIALVAMTFASCEKSYTCECTTTISGTGLFDGTSTASTTFEAKKKDAEAACDKNDVAQTTVDGITSGIECKLK
jgi:hypothetical protein